jgi:hypothetical protein
MKRFLLVSSILLLTLLSTGAEAASLIEQSVGVAASLGADVWSTPENVPSGSNYLGLTGRAAGVGYGLMPYYGLRVYQLFGVEADLSLACGNFNRTDRINPDSFHRWVSIVSWRLPILATFNIPIDLGRLWLGFGPEFTLAQSSSGSQQASTSDYSSPLPTHDVKPIYVTGGFGIVIKGPSKRIEFPIGFRASRNTSQPSNYADRTENNSIRAESSWVYRLVAGIGFAF